MAPIDQSVEQAKAEFSVRASQGKVTLQDTKVCLYRQVDPQVHVWDSKSQGLLMSPQLV